MKIQRLGPDIAPGPDGIPLLPILGKPVLQSVLEKVSTLPVHKIGVNLHHKKEFIESWLRQSPFIDKIEIFFEDPILGTGSALKNAESFLNTSPFLVRNSDIVSDINLGKLREFHYSSDNLVSLAVHNYPEFNKLEIDEKGFFRGIGAGHPHPTPPPSMRRELLETPESIELRTEEKKFPSNRELSKKNPPSPGGKGQGGGGVNKLLAFTGIAVYSPDFLRFLPPRFSSVVDAWLKAVEAGYRVGTYDVSGCYWSDIGTPASYASTIINELRKNGEYIRRAHNDRNGYLIPIFVAWALRTIETHTFGLFRAQKESL